MQSEYTRVPPLSAPARREYVRTHYLSDGVDAVAEVLGTSRSTARNIAWRLGLLTSKTWTPADDAVLREWYDRPVHRPGFLNELAALLKRSRAAVACRANELGICDQRATKKLPASRRVRRKYQMDDERKAAIGEAMRQWIAKHGHPRGALGLKHTPETRAKLSERSRRAWSDPNSRLNSEELRQKKSDAMSRRQADGLLVSGEGMYSRSASGKRADLSDRYFRSSWEANYARFLNWLIERGEIVSWEYECQVFWFEAIKRGTRSYTPDFKVTFPDNHHEWHEVKGWMDQKSRTKLTRMAKYYPAERVVVIGEDWFRSARRSGLPGLIPNWEGKR